MLKSVSDPRQKFFSRIFTSFSIKQWVLKLPFDQLEKGSLTLEIFGDVYRFEGKEAGRHADLTILKPFRAYWLIKTQGELGFAQAYFEHALDTNCLYALMYLGYENQNALQGLLSHKTLNKLHLFKHRKRHNSVDNSKKNISYHYDLGNVFYQKWLDKSMTYSSGIFESSDDTLEQAQQQKYDRLVDQLGVRPGDHVLEIGCGWGGMMQALLERGVKVKGLTLSKEQQTYAQQRLSEFNPQDYDVAYQDYRDETQQYDHIVSIEMFEAVGKEYWQNYFETLSQSLKTGGNAALQVITINEDYAQEYQDSVDFIQTYIFPGGLLPSVEQLKTLAAEHGFEVNNIYEFGYDYAKTCLLWKESFNNHSFELQVNGYDQKFQKMWNYYLDYCAVGFATQHISVHQLTLKKIKEANHVESI